MTKHFADDVKINSISKALHSVRPSSIREGFGYSFVEAILNYGINRNELIHASNISIATLTRRKKQGKLSPVESDKIYRLMTILNAAESLFDGDRKKALDWCRKPAIGLGNQKPINFADTTAGQDEVLNYIDRIEHGVFS